MKKVKVFFALGLFGSLLTIAGELTQGCVVAPDTSNAAAKVFSAITPLPVWRIGLGSTLGALGILLQFFGCYALYLTFENKRARAAQCYFAGMVGYSVLGAIVHVLFSMMMYVYKTAGAPPLADFLLWFMGPIVIIFFALYGTFAAAMAWQIIKQKTPFPRWCWVLNPLLGKALINLISLPLPNTALANGIRFSNMGISSLIIFSVLLVLLPKQASR